MAFGVRKFPDSNDPRDTGFCVLGWEYGAIPAYTYSLKTVGSTGIYAPLNNGITLRWVSNDLANGHWRRFADVPELDIVCRFWIFGSEEPVLLPIPHTINWAVEIDGGGLGIWLGQEYATRPNAITGWPFFELVPFGLPTPGLSNPVEVIPRIWDFPIVP